MLEFPRWKVWLVSLVVVAGIFFSIPSLLAGTPYKDSWPAWLPHDKINLGLDLAGGSHLLLEADARDAMKQRLQKKEDEVQTELRRDPSVDIGDISTAEGRVSFMVRNPTQVDTAVERLRALSKPLALTGNRDWDVQVVDSTRIVLTPTTSGTVQALKDAMSVARDVVRRRIDPSGTREITVVTEGSNRILVEVPGVDNPDQLKRLIGQTARLEFKLVDLQANPADIAQGHAPPGSEVLDYPDAPAGLPFVAYPTAAGQPAKIAVKRRVMVSGDQITRAKQGFDQQSNAPIVQITFDSNGAHRFGRVTQDNVNKPFAIILDNKVLSAPNINEPILGGSAQITGNFTVQSANELAINLASGQLPVKFNFIEERSIGPDLGKDSIHWGAIASAVGTLGVILFMLVTYGRFGVYATIALIVNAFLILACLALFGSALTLPGIAGFVLTIGAAVDANVLINERIREEIRRGRRLLDAVETGYREAFRAIFDANVTHVISAAIMAFFGSGPVRGFAVVLLIGVITSVFTAVYFTRMLVALWLRKARPRELHI